MLIARHFQYNLEVVGADRFAETCPGKMPYQKFESKLFEAVDTFGHGNVRSNFVFGLTPENEMLEYAEYCAKRGVVMDYSVFQPKKNTQFENKSAPTFEALLTLVKSLYKYIKSIVLNQFLIVRAAVPALLTKCTEKSIDETCLLYSDG